MTDRLYYDNPDLREFTASVVRVESAGERQAVWLDRTAFYPTTGGQPFDTGLLDSARVVDVSEDADGDVVHVLDGSEFREGQPVHGTIDWPRRFDHMQQHTGQHILSAACASLFGAKTVSFHLGAEASTIDLSRELTSAEITAVEREANRVVWENRPVAVRYATPEEAAALPLRKESVRTGTLRLIDVENFDLSACGGTHVRQTGAIGLIAVIAWERFKRGQRIEFRCGGRALARLAMLRDTMAASVRLLSVLPQELPAAIDRLQQDARDQKRLLAAQQLELAQFRAECLAAAAQPIARGRLVLEAADADQAGLKALASALTSRPGLVVVLVSRASPSLVVVARSRDLDVSCAGIVSALTTRFGGRGGGTPDLAQAGGLGESPEAILAEARRLLGD